MKKSKTVIDATGGFNDRTVIATYGNKAILETASGNREEWVRSDQNKHYVMYVDNLGYEFSRSVSPFNVPASLIPLP